MAELPITFADIQAAQQRLAGVAHRTPVLTSRTADARCGAQLFFKCENFQRIGAFKFRGAYNAVARLEPAQRAAGVVAYSSGNHAQAIALACRLLASRAVIVMPSDAPRAKVAATRSYGGEVVFYDRYREDREALGRQLAAERGLTLIPPYDHPDVMAGQGSAAAELIETVGPLDVLLAPLGGGGLLSGSAVAAHALSPGCTVIGVEPEAGDDGRQSLRAGHIVHIATPETLADGAQTLHLGQHTFAVIAARVSDIVTVSDAQLLEAMAWFAERMKLVLEPTGVLAAAAVFSGQLALTGKRVGVILSGGNIDLARYAALLAERPAAED
ncbi:MAG: threo-3-hydroxy-L-aspartate ammonia-lyase [Pseudomonadota bacterium]|jgi:threonine dehydratase|nr:threo-3-hydroxy-L-aspartate ammonia-lyase [Pseudomonadota bacterium]